MSQRTESNNSLASKQREGYLAVFEELLDRAFGDEQLSVIELWDGFAVELYLGEDGLLHWRRYEQNSA